MDFKKLPLTELDFNTGQIQGLPPNPREWTDAEIKRLAKSMKGTPELTEARGCIVVPYEGRYVVLGGNLRLAAAKFLKWPSIMCAVLPEGTKVGKLKEIVLKDNSSFGSWDLSLLRRDWAEFDLPEWGIEVTWDTAGPTPDASVSGATSNKAAESNSVTEGNFDAKSSDIEARCSYGDIWQLGDHLLICGDSLDSNTYSHLLRGETVDLVFTDPPYGMGKTSEGIANDNQNAAQLLAFNKGWIKHTFAVLADNGSWYCWGTDESCMSIYADIIRPMELQGLVTFRNLLTWWKGEGGLGVGNSRLRSYPMHSEKCVFVMKGRRGFNSLKEFKIPFCDELNARFAAAGIDAKTAADRVCQQNYCDSETNYQSRLNAFVQHLTQYSMFNKPRKEYWELWFGSDEGYLDFSERYEAAKLKYREGFNYFDAVSDPCNDVWHFKTVTAAEKQDGGGHASVKPQQICQRAIKASSKPGDIVLDCFGGSGSTLIACEQLGRKARLVEYLPKWCDVIIARWEKFTGRKAVKIE